ncbi:MAG: PAS domain-containing sensor histidine kinase [Flavobacterium sp.]|nr:PAS domain-containing sensor histidine kinase [Flavobacterium sp.]
MKNNEIKILKKKYIPTNEFYSLVLDSLQDYSVFTLDTDFVINSWNSGATNIFGYSADEIIGLSFDIIFTEEDIKNKIPDSEIQTSLKDGRATDNRWHIRKDKTLFYAYGLVFPLIGNEGEMLGYVKILRDLTDRKKSENAIKKYVKDLEDLNTHKESVLAILSHDLRSPLAGIIGTTDYLKSNFKKMESTSVQEMLDLVHKSSKDELNMLDNLVEWARIKYAAQVFSPSKIDLLHFVESVFDSLKESAGLKTINLHHEIEENTMVFADEKMLISILQNIVSNAIKHSNNDSKIIISSKFYDNKVIVEIKDTGAGMSKEIQDKLFSPEFSTLVKERNPDKGAGIGLLLVKGFLEKNGGEIWVESIEGFGSSFYFTLPIEEAALQTDEKGEVVFE